MNCMENLISYVCFENGFIFFIIFFIIEWVWMESILFWQTDFREEQHRYTPICPIFFLLEIKSVLNKETKENKQTKQYSCISFLYFR